MKMHTLALLLLPAFCLTSCGEDNPTSSKTPTYHVETSTSSIGNNSVLFGSAFNENQFEIEDQDSIKVSNITAAMVTGFDSKPISFGKDLTATVAYQGLALPLTYQIRSDYAIDNAYSVTLREDSSLRLDYVAGFSELTSYTIPETLSQLPNPLNTWPVTKFRQGMSKTPLVTLNLNKSLTVLSSDLNRSVKIVPIDEGKIAYQNGYLIANNGAYEQTLIGLSSTLTDESLAIPEGVPTSRPVPSLAR
jgi:hypothetical protein